MRCRIAAQLTSTSTRPQWEIASATTRSHSVVRERSAAIRCGAREPCGGCGEPVAIDVDHRHLRALSEEQPGDLEAEAAGGARDDRRALREHQ